MAFCVPVNTQFFREAQSFSRTLQKPLCISGTDPLCARARCHNGHELMSLEELEGKGRFFFGLRMEGKTHMAALDLSGGVSEDCLWPVFNIWSIKQYLQSPVPLPPVVCVPPRILLLLFHFHLASCYCSVLHDGKSLKCLVQILFIFLKKRTRCTPPPRI